MTEKIEIGINQRIPISILEMALIATLEGKATAEYFASLASSEYSGQNRIGKAVSVINRLTIRNKLLPFMQENKDDLLSAFRSSNDRPLVFAAIICAAYSFGYDTVAILGKFFHVQPQVNTKLIVEKMSAKYGANRSLPNGLYCILPMLIEAGLLNRPEAGFYEAKRVERASDFAMILYRKAFLLNNPNYKENDDIDTHPFFEFITKTY